MAFKPTTVDGMKAAAERDLFTFAKLILPSHCWGSVHSDVMRWMTRENGKADKLVLLPRGHLKSTVAAVWCAWMITRQPEITILYVSATEDLAIQQLYTIKSILESDIYRAFWPDMIDPQEAKREEWSARNIKVDHPRRKELGVRDRTVAARSVGSNTVGLHCDVIAFDDLVVPDNAYSEEGRAKVQAAYSQFSSVANAGRISLTVGTRYHGKDIYNQMLSTEVEVFDEKGDPKGSELMYDCYQKPVEEDGVFLWPRSFDPKSKKWFGFDMPVLSKIRAQYFASGERAQYAGQYYNDPQSGGEGALTSDKFQYYDRKYLTKGDDGWQMRGRRLSVFAACDLAFSAGSNSDYTAIAVIGVADDGHIYILDLDQFRTDKYERMYSSISRLHSKWDFRKLLVETNAGANLVAEYMRDRIRQDGHYLSVEGARAIGEKTARCQSILMPRYENKTMWHFEGGYISAYEEQLVLTRPSHDDLRDAVAAAVQIAKPAAKRRTSVEAHHPNVLSVRFGGSR